jgi:hypothetical protein
MIKVSKFVQSVAKFNYQMISSKSIWAQICTKNNQ